jgi:rod shape-determining protein MreC
MFKFLKFFRLSLILLAVAGLLIFLHYLKILVPLENGLIKIFSLIQRPIYSLGVKVNDLYANFTLSNKLAIDNQTLSQQVKQLTLENNLLKNQLAENQQLLRQNQFLARSGLTAVTALAIGKTPEPNLQALILNAGSQAGVKVGLPVISDDGFFVGKIWQVKNNSSIVLLINDPQSQVAAMVQNQDNTFGVVIGEHGLSLKMELIPKNEPVKIGDLVVTSGFESNIIRGLVIGRVSRLVNEPTSFFQTVQVQPLVKLDNLTVFSILINPDDN